MAVNARDGMLAGHVLQMESKESHIRHRPIKTLLQRIEMMISGFSSSSRSSLSSSGEGISWTTSDFIRAHEIVKESKKYNFEGCKIPIPTAIRYDWIEAALGSEVSAQEIIVLI